MPYFIEIVVLPIANLVAKLQAAYDNGAAGFFDTKQTADGIKVSFERNLADDLDYIELHMMSGATQHQAACKQLARELAEFSGNELGEVIQSLLSPQSRVIGLDSLA